MLRSLNYLLTGAIVGWLVDSRARALGALARHVELSSDVIVSGADGYLDAVNPAFTRILGHAVEDVVGRPYIDFVHPDDHDKSLAVEDELEAGRGPIATFENRYRHRDGKLPVAGMVDRRRPCPGTRLRGRTRHHRAQTGRGARATGARRPAADAGGEGGAAATGWPR